MMKWTSTLTALSLSVIGFSALSAQDNNYQSELTVSYMDFSSNKLDIDPTWGVQYSYYGSPISQSASPYQLNRFLSQTSVLDLNYSNTDSNNTYGIAGKYVFDSKWFVGANYQSTDTGSFGDADIYNVNLGYYLNEFTSVYVAATKTDSGNSRSAIIIDDYQYDIGIKSFIETTYGEGVYFTADYSFSDDEIKTPIGTTKLDYRNWGVSVDYYLTNAFSIGGSYSDASYDNAEDTYAVNAAYFIRLVDNISLSIRADKTLEPSSSGFSYDIGLVGRF
ncbi:hypothetical protein JQC92_06595 [Shewanella sp. 202IG2-18]|uniref:putative porin n=1 Tax=Parashewanella hymeniacidonis TaxID=2807618 RepID=UPI001960D07D|nr:putative porin [Parashewanella hymeniacidonis]MBM7071710.1 hypothetical protein [Parashewanella hymeniacidonis]